MSQTTDEQDSPVDSHGRAVLEGCRRIEIYHFIEVSGSSGCH